MNSRYLFPAVGMGSMAIHNLIQEESPMKKSTMIAAGILLTMTIAWAAYGQAGGGARGGQMREAQLKAIAGIQEQLAKLKTLMEQPMGAQGQSFQDMSEEERTKMRETMTKRNAEQQAILTAIQQDVDRLRVRQLVTEHDAAMAPLKDALASAQKENAKETAGKLDQVIAQRQKQFEDKVTAMGYTMEQVQRMGQRRQRQQ
jgi:hypothetical protein